MNQKKMMSQFLTHKLSTPSSTAEANEKYGVFELDRAKDLAKRGG